MSLFAGWNWCAKCGGPVGPMHEHWGDADYIRHPITAQWTCRHCRALVAEGNDRAPVKCRCMK